MGRMVESWSVAVSPSVAFVPIPPPPPAKWLYPAPTKAPCDETNHIRVMSERTIA